LACSSAAQPFFFAAITSVAAGEAALVVEGLGMAGGGVEKLVELRD
jgi:hypothetical protein